jgi:hypothetical protein
MKKFKVSVNEEQGGYLYIDAEDADEARELADEVMNDDGFDQRKYPVKMTHRATHIYEATEDK